MAYGINMNISEAEPASASGTTDFVRVSKQMNKQVYLAVLVFFAAFVLFSVIVLQSPDNIGVFVGGLVVIIGGFIYYLVKFVAAPIEVGIQGTLITESRNGVRIGEVDLAEISAFGFMKDNRGNVWVRITPKSGPTFRYVPKGFSKEVRAKFHEFGSMAQEAVDSINRA